MGGAVQVLAAIGAGARWHQAPAPELPHATRVLEDRPREASGEERRHKMEGEGPKTKSLSNQNECYPNATLLL